MQTVTIDVDDAPETFELDFENERWHSAKPFHESAFPLVAEVGGVRYELYSDGTFGEEDLP